MVLLLRVNVLVKESYRYDDVVAEKDAKTLELIEGSDPAMQQMAHEMKVAQERRKHQQRLRKVRSRCSFFPSILANDVFLDSYTSKSSEHWILVWTSWRIRSSPRSC